MIVEFAGILDNLPLEESETVRTFRALIAPKNTAELDRLAVHARALTLQHFGRTMRLFAPLYLSNECINSCRYCGFSRENPILRVTLSVDEVIRGGSPSRRRRLPTTPSRSRRTSKIR